MYGVKNPLFAPSFGISSFLSSEGLANPPPLPRHSLTPWQHYLQLDVLAELGLYCACVIWPTLSSSVHNLKLLSVSRQFISVCVHEL